MKYIKMKNVQIAGIIVACLLALGIMGYIESSDGHDGEVKTPSASNAQKGKNFQDVVRDFEEKGFTNIRTEILYDLITGWLTKDGEVESVSVDGNKEYRAGAWYQNDVEVVITYHTFPKNEEKPEPTPDVEEEPQSVEPISEETSEPTVENSTEPEVIMQDEIEKAAKEALELTFPVENAKRAAVVAFTNRFAMDVFTQDGNDYDITKFHSYADVSGDVSEYFMHVKSEGTWTVKNERTWHVEHLNLHTYGNGSVINASLDVSYDGENYIISNLAGQAPSYNDISDFEKESDFSLFFIVPSELINDDRIDSDVVAREEVVSGMKSDLYFSAMEGLVALSSGIIIEYRTAKQDDYSMIYVIVSDEWYNSEEYQKERFAETISESIKRISKETGMTDFVSVYFYDSYDKKLADPKILGGYKILR